MAKPITVKGIEARLYQPTDAKPYWRIKYPDRATGKIKQTSGGKSYEQAEVKARMLCGEFVEGWRTGEQAPDLNEAAELWLAAQKPHWAARTYQHNRNLAKKLTTLYGDRPLTRISPADISRIEVAGLSRNECQRIRTTIRGIFSHSKNWLPEGRAELLAQAIALPGAKTHSGRSPRVERGDIPSSQLVAGLINMAYHSLQIGPLDDPENTTLDWETGEKTRNLTEARLPSAIGFKDASSDYYRDGIPPKLADANRRTRVMAGQTVASQRIRETENLAGCYRQAALITALGAAGGLRIGEVLALRVRHFLSLEQITWYWAAQWNREQFNRSGGSRSYRGLLDVSEQANQSGTGKILIQGTKGKTKERQVHLPAFLPRWTGFKAHTHRQQIAAIVSQFGDDRISLWDAAEEEEVQLWREGFIPVSYILWQRIIELWHEAPTAGKSPRQQRLDFQDLLLFPTRTKSRQGRNGEESVITSPGRKKRTAIVAGTGSFQQQSNYQRFINPLYDRVAEEMNEWPEHRTNAKQSNGWTHHGLRHWAVSSRLHMGVSLPLVAKEMGHADSAYTLERYGHVVDEGVSELGYEY